MRALARRAVLPARIGCSIATLLLLSAAGGLRADATIRVSVASDGTQADRGAGVAEISADGGSVVFQSSATNLAPGKLSGAADIYLHDRRTGETERVNRSSDGTPGNVNSAGPSVSGDGLRVAFVSQDTNLVPGDTNATWDVFVRDRQAGTTTRVNVSEAGAQADGPSFAARISDGGVSVAFTSQATTLVAGKSSNRSGVFVRDLATDRLEWISARPDGLEGAGTSRAPDVSEDGAFVVFASNAGDLVAGDVNGTWDIFLRDRAAGSTALVSVGLGGAPAAGASDFPAISADGSVVAFVSTAGNLVDDDDNDVADVFVRDLEAETTERVSVATGGAEATGASQNPAISADGRFVAFRSEAPDLVPGDGNGVGDVFVHDRLTGATRRVSVSAGGGEAGASSALPALSGRGRAVAFLSLAADLVPGDTNGRGDVFVREEFVPLGLLHARSSPWSGRRGSTVELTVDAELADVEASLELLSARAARRAPLGVDPRGRAGGQQVFELDPDGDLWSGSASIAADDADLALFDVEGRARRPDGRVVTVDAAPVKVEWIRGAPVPLSACQAVDSGFAGLFGRRPDPGAPGSGTAVPRVPFLGFGLAASDPARERSCRTFLADRSLGLLLGDGYGPVDPVLAGERVESPDSLPERARKALEAIEEDDCIDFDDRDRLRELVGILDEIDDPAAIRAIAAEIGFEGDLDGLVTVARDFAIPLIRKPLIQILEGLNREVRIPGTGPGPRTRYRKVTPALESICWKREDGCDVLEVTVNRKFELSISQYGVGLDLEFLRDSHNTAEPHRLRICFEEDEEGEPTCPRISVDQGALRFDFDDLGGLFGSPEIPIDDFFLREIKLGPEGWDVSGWTSENTGLFGIGGWDVPGEEFESRVLCPGDLDCDGMPDRYEEKHGCLDPVTPDADDDPDGDGLTSGAERLLGTDPCARTPPPEEDGDLGGGVSGEPRPGPGWIDTRTAQVEVQKLVDPDGATASRRLRLELEVYEPIPTAPQEEFASWHFLVDLDGDRATGSGPAVGGAVHPGVSLPGESFPDLGIDLWADLVWDRTAAESERLGRAADGVAPDLGAGFQALLFLGDDLAALRPESGILQVELSPDRRRVVFSLDADALEQALAARAGAPNRIAADALRWAARTTLCTDRDDCADPTGDVYTEERFVPRDLSPCVAGPTRLCLAGGRFAVTADFAVDGTAAPSRAEPLTRDTGWFWFFEPTNLELVVKIVDACSPFDRFWLFAGGLTDVEVVLRVRDTASGVVRSYENPGKAPFVPIQETDAFPTCGFEEVPVTAPPPLVASRSQPAQRGAGSGNSVLALQDGRFEVEILWSLGDDTEGGQGVGRPVGLTRDTGWFWFFAPSNLEVVVKVLDACAEFDRYWVFAGGLTNVGVEVRVTDRQSGQEWVSRTSAGDAFSPILATDAFATCPP